MKPEIILIAAVGSNLAIGRDNQLLWKLPSDLPRFKRLTTGHTIVMGRKTYESIGRPLPGRRNIVLSQNSDLKIEGVEVFQNLDDVWEATKDAEKVFVIGGGEIYAQALPYVDRLEITEVSESVDADAFFPNFDLRVFQETYRDYADELDRSTEYIPHFSYVTYVRKV